MSVSRYKKWMTEAFINEDDETAIRKKKFHVGKGVYVDKEKDKDNPKKMILVNI